MASRGTDLLKATDAFRRLQQKVTRYERALEKARLKCAKAEADYLRLVADAFHARQVPATAEKEGPPAIPA